MRSNTLWTKTSRMNSMSSSSMGWNPRSTKSTPTPTSSTHSSPPSPPTASCPLTLAWPPPSSTLAPTRAFTLNVSSSSTTSRPIPKSLRSTFTRRPTAGSGNPVPSSSRAVTRDVERSGTLRRTRWIIRFTSASAGPRAARCRAWCISTGLHSDRSTRRRGRGRLFTVIASRSHSSVHTVGWIWTRSCSSTFLTTRRVRRLKSVPRRARKRMEGTERLCTQRWTCPPDRTSCQPTWLHPLRCLMIAWRTFVAILSRRSMGWEGPQSLRTSLSLLTTMAMRHCKKVAERISWRLEGPF
mmetsp:Transcript_4966/g.8282  ORF Transcript_4966/g.8282 Transcript_4966/m.8282 type:complete len:297 (+) Transcript_4966:604-1494(+)